MDTITNKKGVIIVILFLIFWFLFGKLDYIEQVVTIIVLTLLFWIWLYLTRNQRTKKIDDIEEIGGRVK